MSYKGAGLGFFAGTCGVGFAFGSTALAYHEGLIDDDFIEVYGKTAIALGATFTATAFIAFTTLAGALLGNKNSEQDILDEPMEETPLSQKASSKSKPHSSSTYETLTAGQINADTTQSSNLLRIFSNLGNSYSSKTMRKKHDSILLEKKKHSRLPSCNIS